jgi:hypothetical protein
MTQVGDKASNLSKKVLFIGNDINNINNEKSWENLVADLRRRVGKKNDAKDLIKQFPLVFENLLNYGIKNKSISNENELKEIVANHVTQIKSNPIHERIKKLNPEHIITANYDFVLEEGLDVEKKSRIDETRFSIFRRYTDRESGRNFWHIHGDCKHPETINLGFEHYSGQLQYLRNYVVTGTQYKTINYNNEPLLKRLSTLSGNPDSWVDLLFTNEVHIIGLCLDFIEIDLWWLLTYRAKLVSQKGRNIQNKINYYIPLKYCEESEGKLELLKNMGVNVIKHIDKNGLEYYNKVFDYVEKKSLSIKDLLTLD